MRAAPICSMFLAVTLAAAPASAGGSASFEIRAVAPLVCNVSLAAVRVSPPGVKAVVVQSCNGRHSLVFTYDGTIHPLNMRLDGVRPQHESAGRSAYTGLGPVNRTGELILQTSQPNRALLAQTIRVAVLPD